MGLTHTTDEGFIGASEVKYDLTGEKAGIKGSHAEIRVGRNWKPFENLTGRSRLRIGSEVNFDY